MNSTQIRILEEMNQESLGGLLERQDGMRLPPQLGADVGREQVQRDFSDDAREGEFLDQEVVGALVVADFSQGDGAWFVAMAAAVGGGVSG